MIVTNPRYISVQGYPVLYLEIDGRPYRIPPDGRKLLAHGAVAVPGLDHRFIVPANPDDGRLAPTEFDEATNDPEVVRLAMNFFNTLDAGKFEPGRVT